MKAYSRYKQSDITFIGDIPEQWEIQRLGSIGYFSASGIDKKSVDGQEEILMANYTDVYGNKTNAIEAEHDFMITTAPKTKIKQHSLKQGDILFTPSSETIDEIGISAVVLEDLPGVVYSYHLIRFRPTITIDLNFCKYL
ncbi:MAG TPA: hypothetical protein DCL08_04160 [Anaerolineaceae bacterium]|nr:MAG: Type I restriction-modification system,specificity subunit S [Anaerolineaceae bacterium 46_22]HAF48421.1 hypothetical protein [Anaerolineaceae bacterium]